MANYDKEVSVTLPYDEPGKGWALKIVTNYELVHFNLHWGDKLDPTHTQSITRSEFKEIVKDLGFMMEA